MSMMAGMVIRPCSNDDVEKAADNKAAGGTVGDKCTHNSFSTSGIVKKCVKNRRRPMLSSSQANVDRISDTGHMTSHLTAYGKSPIGIKFSIKSCVVHFCTP